ncbi:ATP-binding cassette domain-containing protein [Helicobacter pametensis]|uniref:ATP-binding cassette domain-containing protein n=1 Tax=Helicobacter pametensis TaxID=95149 RepID=UPI0004B5DD1E|nr:ATP-binding cassette domain-containing protein [Helicobacter pametensis]
MLEIENLSLSIQDQILLDHITFSSYGNLGVLGESGSGKSSLLKSLVVLFSSSFLLQAKTLRVNKFNVLHLRGKALRKFRQRVGFISADLYGGFYPLSSIGSVFDALMMYSDIGGSKRDRKKLAFEMFEQMGLEQLDRIWNSYIRELSGGMAKRVQIALCLICGAKILLCDEITASLDEENAQKLIALLKSMRIPSVFATHQISHLKALCNEAIVLKDGRLIAHGLIETLQDLQNDYVQSLFGGASC